ncbi:MAG: PEGA domain-containing protein, partial [Myxococcota bacterium]
SVGVVGGERVASVTLLDGEIARPVGGASATFGSDEEMLGAAGALAGQTFGWEDAPQFVQASFSFPENETLKLAVMDMTGLGLDEETSKNLTTVLTGSLKQIQGADVVSQEDIRSMLELEATRQSLGCTEMSCIAEVGGALGVDRMISGSVGLMGDRYVVSLRLINPRESKVEARVTESFVGDESQLLPAVRFSGKRLLGALGQQEGSLAVSTDTSNASLFINEAETGELPMEALSGLEPGRYALRVAKNGYFDWRSDVFIEPGAATPVWVEMTERPDEWYETWWFWSAVGVVAVGAATVIILDQTAITSSDAGNAPF